MSKKQSILQRFKGFYSSNPAIVLGICWVTVVPSLGSLTALNLLYSHQHILAKLQLWSAETVLVYLLSITLFMGLAVLPTTFLAIMSGFIFGWISFPYLVVGYSLATLLGYQVGKKLGGESLAFLLENYPKADQLITDKKGNISQLIFFVRLSPVIPFALSNLLFALLKVDLKKVVWIGLWGMLPRTLMAFTSGVLGESLLSALQESNGSTQYVIILALLLISGWGIYRFFKKKK